MNRKHIVAGAAVVAAVLSIAGVARAHVPKIGASCETGLDVSLTKYSGVDDVTVWLDGRRIVGTTFTGSYVLHVDLDRAVAHTWRVRVDGHGEKSPDVSGTVPACEATTTTTTTTVATSTTTPATSSSTTIVTPPRAVHPPSSTVLPATGRDDRLTLYAALVLVTAGGIASAVATRRR